MQRTGSCRRRAGLRTLRLGQFKGAAGCGGARTKIAEMISNCRCQFYSPTEIGDKARECGIGPGGIMAIARDAARKERKTGNSAAAQAIRDGLAYLRAMRARHMV
jgi:hypothetical protein